MSRTRDIDNEDVLFVFDPYELLTVPHHLEDVARVIEPRFLTPQHSSLPTPSLALSPSSHRHPDDLPLNSQMDEQASSFLKGKRVSRLMSGLSDVPGAPETDMPVALASSSDESAVSSQWESPSSPLEVPFTGVTRSSNLAADCEDIGSSSGKGKAREQPPSLPPLVFFPTGLEYAGMEWPSTNDFSPQTAGPSSYGSGFTSIGESEQSISHDVSPLRSPESPAPVVQVSPGTRQRTLSSLSARSTRSLSALSLSKVKDKLSGTKTPGNIARRLRFKRGDSSPDANDTGTPSQSPVIDTDILGVAELGRGSCFLPWARDLKSRNIPPQGTLVDIDVDLPSPFNHVSPIYRMGPPSDVGNMRAKGRSYSSPFPLPSSPLDLIAVTPAEISQPIPVKVPNYFEEYLPRELRLKVLASFVNLYEEDHRRAVANGRWTARKAGRNRWVGIERGIVELLKLSRVSKAWQSLVYDGQLWIHLPRVPPNVLTRLAKVGGGFVKQLCLTGMTTLSPDMLTDMTEGFCIDLVHPGTLPYTRITTIDLQGCTALSTRSLHHLLIRSPALEKLCVRGLPAVTNTTCTILATYRLKVVSLDISRCSNLDGEGIRSLASSTLLRGEKLCLKVLRLGGLKRVTDEMMQLLGKAAPDLEVLDLSYARDLHNSGIDAFVSLSEEEAQEVESVQLTARQAGRDPTDASKYWKRVTRLRHIALSSCPMLTDHACTHLAHAVPQLEFLELAGIGPDIRNTGLVHLLETTPYIRRLDLEDACEITDAVLAALTPQPQASLAPSRNQPPPPPQTGHALEQLIISYAGNVTNEALLNLIRNCPQLRVLEADNTRINGLVMKEFVKLARERKRVDPYLCAVDCRGVGEQAVKDVAPHTRPRKGWRAWEARKLAFLDGRDDEGLGVGQDECDEARVVLKTFYSWQTVDAVRGAREKRRKAGRRSANGSAGGRSGDAEGAAYSAVGRTRWWSPNGRRSGAASLLTLEGPEGRDSCTIM